MKTRQFHQLSSGSLVLRDQRLVAGLKAIGRNVSVAAGEIDICRDADAPRGAQVLHNIAEEEAGKFLVLLDVTRAGRCPLQTISNQCRRASNHLAKLIYAQIASYSIGDRAELIRAIDSHRASHYIDGPNDFDFILRNDLLQGREGPMYVDLVEVDDELQWVEPIDLGCTTAPRSALLVSRLLESGLISVEGFECLRAAWADFDHAAETTSGEWGTRTAAALTMLADTVRPTNPDWGVLVDQLAWDWTMPLVHLDLSEKHADLQELRRVRDREYDRFIEREYGPFD